MQRRGGVPLSLLPPICRLCINALKTVHFIKHVHNAIEAAAIYATVEGDVRVGNLRFAAPVLVNRYNASHDDPKAKSELESCDGRVVSHIASYRTPSGSSSLRFGGPYSCMCVQQILKYITINPSHSELVGLQREFWVSNAAMQGTTAGVCLL